MQTGDKVVYVMKDMPELGLFHNKVYTVLGTAECGSCPDGLCIDVGVKLPEDKKFVICEDCLNIISIGDEYFLYHRGFRKLDEVKLEAAKEVVRNGILTGNTEYN